MFKLSTSDALAILGIVLAIILVVLDKTGKLKGPVLVALMIAAGILTIPCALSLSWVSEAAPGLAKVSRGLTVFFAVGLLFSGLIAWISQVDIHEDRIATKPPSTGSSPKKSAFPEMTLQPGPGDIELDFKSSPLFTAQTKKRITKDLTKFRDYLVRLHIPVPKTVPPLATRKKEGQNDIGSIGTYTPEGLPPYRGEFLIVEDSVSDPKNFTGLYCSYVLQLFFFGPDSPLELAFGAGPKANVLPVAKLSMLQERLCTYLNYSFWGVKKIKKLPKTTMSSLAGALWDLREKYGHEFVDNMVGYTFRAMADDPAKLNEDVDTYFVSRMKIAETVVDNDGSRWPEIEKSLSRYGVTVRSSAVTGREPKDEPKFDRGAPAGAAQGVSRSTLEAYAGIGIGAFAVVFPITWWVKAILIVFVGVMLVDVVYRHPKTRHLQFVTCLAVSTLGLLALALICYVPIHRQYVEDGAAALEGDLLGAGDGLLPNGAPPWLQIGDSKSMLIMTPQASLPPYFKPFPDAELLLQSGKKAPLISTTIRDRLGNLVVEIKQNHWRVYPSYCSDKNYTDSALEVKDSAGHVLLQIKLVGGPSRVQVQGEWWSNEGRGLRVVKTKDGLAGEAIPLVSQNQHNDELIGEIFRYPSKKHWREML